MNKSVIYAKNGALLLGIGNAFINFLEQLNRTEDTPGVKVDWGEVGRSGLKGAVWGAGVGLVAGAIADHQNSLISPVNTDLILAGLISGARLDLNDPRFESVENKVNAIKEKLKEYFSNKLHDEPMLIGSTHKGTALADRFDVDICLNFKHNSFCSTRDMYHAVWDCLDGLLGKYSILEIREQKKSIGVIVEVNGEDYKVDVVPVKLSRSKINNKNRAGYLFVNKKGLFTDNSTYTKTNIHLLRSIKLSEDQKKIVIALKVWKLKYDLPLSSHFLEHLVLDAYKYNKNKIPRGLTGKIIMVLKHIEKDLEVAVIRSVENTNNILSNISPTHKNKIIQACSKVLDEYEYQPNSIVEMLG